MNLKIYSVYWSRINYTLWKRHKIYILKESWVKVEKLPIGDNCLGTTSWRIYRLLRLLRRRCLLTKDIRFQNLATKVYKKELKFLTKERGRYFFLRYQNERNVSSIYTYYANILWDLGNEKNRYSKRKEIIDLNIDCLCYHIICRNKYCVWYL